MPFLQLFHIDSRAGRLWLGLQFGALKYLRIRSFFLCFAFFRIFLYMQFFRTFFLIFFWFDISASVLVFFLFFLSFVFLVCA